MWFGLRQLWIVEGEQPKADATMDVPPSASMMLEAVMPTFIAENAMPVKGLIADCVIDAQAYSAQFGGVLNSRQLLERLKAQGVKNVQIARVLNVDPARVTEMNKPGGRRLLLDEAVKLVEAFQLESGYSVEPLHPAIPRLIARHIAGSLGLDTQADDPRMLELVADLQAFSRFVADPQVRESLTAAENFFRSMTLRREAGPVKAHSGSDLRPTH